VVALARDVRVGLVCGLDWRCLFRAKVA
jgi:hypothetical protein